MCVCWGYALMRAEVKSPEMLDPLKLEWISGCEPPDAVLGI